MSASDGASQRSPVTTGIAALCVVMALAAIVIAAGWPAQQGFWVRDDLTQLAYVRLLGTPWPLFVQDHFPVPGTIYRPLGFASLWLSEQLFARDYASHLIADLLLHALVAAALYRLLRSGVGSIAAFMASLLFALLPTTMATALSWSNRFDLLATLFTLLACRSFIDWVRTSHWTQAGFASLALLAALASKESGSIAVIAMFSMGIVAASSRALRKHSIVAMAIVAALTVIYFGWRWHLLSASANAVIGDSTLVAVVANGVLIWWQSLPGYLVGTEPWRWLVVTLPAVVLVATATLLVAAWRCRDVKAMLLVSAVTMLLLPAVVQAPIAVLNAIPVSATMSAVEYAMQARLYYMPAAALAMLVALLIERAGLTGSTSLARSIVLVAAAILACAAAWQSHRVATAHGIRSAEIAGPARAVVDWVERHALPDAPCRVVVIGYQPPPEWAMVTPIDSVVKALTRDIDRVSGCLFAHEQRTYIHQFARGRVDAASMHPWTPRRHEGIEQPPLLIGGLVVAYLEPPTSLSDDDQATMQFLSIEHGTVVDISESVRQHQRDIHLQ